MCPVPALQFQNFFLIICEKKNLSNTSNKAQPSDSKIPTKKVWVKLIHVIDNIVTLGTSVAVLQTLADTLETAGGTEKHLNNVETTETVQGDEDKRTLLQHELLVIKLSHT